MKIKGKSAKFVFCDDMEKDCPMFYLRSKVLALISPERRETFKKRLRDPFCFTGRDWDSR